jgi:hypothetical protein
MMLCVSHPNNIAFMNFTICKVFYLFWGHWARLWLYALYFKNGPVYEAEPGY